MFRETGYKTFVWIVVAIFVACGRLNVEPDAYARYGCAIIRRRLLINIYNAFKKIDYIGK